MVNSTDRRFASFHLANPQVYESIVEHARKLRKKSGVARITTVFALVREDGHAVNDLFRGRYARLVMRQEKDLANAFETRRMRS